jgi:hypothetical protein
MYEIILATTIEVADIQNGITVNINNTHKATFLEYSNITKQYRQDKDLCIRKLVGGLYFFIDGTMIDHRDSLYTGYVMSDDTLKSLMNNIGFLRNVSKKDIKGLHLVTSGRSEYVLANYHTSSGFEHGMVNLLWTWSPFSDSIRYSFKIVTEHGEVISNKNMFVNKVKVTDSNWLYELKRHSTYFLKRITDILDNNFRKMSNEYSAVADIQTVQKFAIERNIPEIAEKTEEGAKLSKMTVYEYAVELLQYDAVGDGYLYNVINNVLWK